MNKPKAGWYIGDYNRHGGDFLEYCWGITCTGYWSGEDYHHDFWGLALGRRTFGVGRIVEVCDDD